MLDLLLFWSVVLLPVATVAAAALYLRWKPMAPAPRAKEMTFVAVAATVLAVGWLAWTYSRTADEESRHLHFRFPEYLVGFFAVYAIVLGLQWRSLAGLALGRLWFSFLVRSSVLVLLALAMAGLQVVVERDVLTVLFALDVSKSVPPQEQQRALDYVEKAMGAKPANDKAGLIVFGERAATDQTPRETFLPPKAKNIKTQVEDGGTDIAAAFKRARSTFEGNTSRRLVLFTDGRQTLGDAEGALRDIQLDNVDVWVVPLRRSESPEILVDQVKVPNELRWEQPFDARVFVTSNVATKAWVHLKLNDKVVPDPEKKLVTLEPGRRNAVVFEGLKLLTGGAHEVKAWVEPVDSADDTLSQNNEAYAFTDVETDSRILILTSDNAEVEHVRRALEGQKFEVDIRSGTGLPSNPEEYRRYDCIVLANIARGFLGEQQMAVIESCVKDQGAGLVMIGGDQSFGGGDYLNTPIERALPVSMELKNQKIMPSGALVIVLHTCEFGDGNAWGKKIAKAAINVLAAQDYAGLLYFGNWGGNTWLFKPTIVARKQWMFAQINGCDPGDMPDLDGIVSMGVQGLANLSNVSAKHMIIITDGDPSKPSGGTVAAARNANVSMTIVTIAPHSAIDENELKRIANATKGRYYQATDAKKLPLIFIKEAAVVRKSLIHSDENGIPVRLGATGEILREFGSGFPEVKAFVVTQIKDKAELHLYASVKGEKMPILARWQYGLGKAVAFTSDATNRWAPAWISWSAYRKFWTNIFQWVSRTRMPSNHNIQVSINGDEGKVILEAFDKDAKHVNFASLIGTAAEPGIGENADATSHLLHFTQTLPGRYEATFPARKQGIFTVTVTDVSNPNAPQSIVTGQANPYSAEYRFLDPDMALLNRLGEAAGKNGQSNLKELDELSKEPRMTGLFTHNLPPAQSPTDIFWPLLLAALCLFPIDVAVRRLHIDPLVALRWLGDRIAPAFAFLRTKKEAVADALAEAARSTVDDRSAPPPLMPTGSQSREAQSRYEQAGRTQAAQEMDLKPKDGGPAQPKAVGGKKLTEADEAASDYTRALLKAKRRARKDKN